MKKMQLSLVLVLLLSLVLSACAPQIAEPVVTEAPQVQELEPTTQPEPTKAPEPTATLEPTEVPLDVSAVIGEMITRFNSDNSYLTISAAKLNEALADKPPFLLDLRDASEIETAGYIAGSVNIPIKELTKNLDKLPGLDDAIVVYCASGHRGGIALAVLASLGYTNVKSLSGGIGAWTKAGFPAENGLPPAAATISSPIVSDAQLFSLWDTYLSNLPEGYSVVKSDQLAEMLADKAPFLLDVRTQGEWDAQGYIEGATLIPLTELMVNLDKLPAKDAPIVIYCGSGHRGAVVLAALNQLGWTNIKNLAGGLNAWKAAKLPVAGWVDWKATWTEFLTTLPEGFFTIKAADLNTALAENPPFILDVREAAELENGYIAGAVNIPTREVLKNLDKLPALNEKIVIYCASGHRGAMVMSVLRLLGYSDVLNLAGGTGAWVKAELPLETGTLDAPVSGAAPEVDPIRLRDLDKFLTELPDNFFTVKASDFNVELTGSPVPTIIDVRSAEEFATGFITGAANITITDLLKDLTLLPANKADKVVVLCASGHRGAMAMMALRMMGWSDVRNLAGGMGSWVAAELPLEKP